MKIDPATIVVTILVVGSFALPFLLDLHNRRRKARQLLQDLKAMALHHQCTLHHHGTCGPNALGIDEQRNMLFFIHRAKAHAADQVVDLQQVGACAAVPVEAKARPNQAPGLLERVELEFAPRQKQQPPIRLLLHHKDHGNPCGDELPFARQWAQRINQKR